MLSRITRKKKARLNHPGADAVNDVLCHSKKLKTSALAAFNASVTSLLSNYLRDVAAL